MIEKRIVIKREEVAEGTEFVEIPFEEWNAKVGDEGYYLIADVNKCGSHMCHFTDKEDQEYILEQSLMPIFGIKNKDGFAMIIAEGMKCAFRMRVGVKDGNYYAIPRFVLDGDMPFEDISLLKVEFGQDTDYSDLANYYRDYQLKRGACISLKERVKDNEQLKYAVDAPEIRIRMGWKPAPAIIKEQTVENEPEMKVACTFDRVKDIIDELKQAGVDKAQFCLVGWNKSGHDGRYPQIFPVEERLGGEQKLRELIAYAQENGYQIVCHTNSTDCYSIAEDFSDDIVIKKKDGSLSLEQTGWSGGRLYHLCPKKALEFAKRDLPKVADLGFKGIHYIDVMSVVSLRKCYNPNHPVNQGETNTIYREIAKECHSLFGGFASEGVFDFLADCLDYGLYVAFGDNKIPLFDKEVPLWQMVYNGIILSNPSTTTVNYPIKHPKNRLKLMEYGGRPSFYFYSKFMTNPGGNIDWLGKEDMECVDEESLKGAVAGIKEAYEEYKERRYLQYEFIVKHLEVSPGVFEVTYSDGTVVKVDYNEMTVKRDKI